MELSKRANEEANKPTTMLMAIFWVLVGLFIVIAGTMLPSGLVPGFREYFSYIFFPASAIFFLLGLVLLFLSVKAKIARVLKGFLVLTGASAVGFLISIILHNFVYALFIYWFGADFWSKIGIGDEPFFFILAIFVCPIVFLVGAVGSIVMFIKGKA